MHSAERLVKLLKEYEDFADPLVLQLLIECADTVLINSSGYSCVESIMTLRSYGYRVDAKQVVGEPDPKVIGTIIGNQLNIRYGAVMTPCQKRLMRLLDTLDEALHESEQLGDAACVDLMDENVQWTSGFKATRAEFNRLACQIFFEPSARRVRFGELVLFCKEAGIELNSCNSNDELAYFAISTPYYKLRVERSWL